eukprot:TRINITY_DN16710_c0_g1_i1.p1 TRINITY_DN16710_c0_g1~~TRINITY_DN16710_c0_g1_i1.p1  ORF type:complete len:357 (+),score=90.81 TRINITY_DN16710_c0_g1_i1:25-1071(+)
MTFIVQLGVFTGFYSITGAYSLAGVVALGLSIITTMISISLMKWCKNEGALMDAEIRAFFLRVMLPLFLFIIVLGLYAVRFQRANSGQQAIMVIAISLVTFFARRIQLSMLDRYPLVISMLWAGFFFQSLNDFFQTLAFPHVNKPALFSIIWIANAFGNFSLLFLLSDTWILKVRPNLKIFLMDGLRCKKLRQAPEPDFSENLQDRGHGTNVGGYRRRQFTFFFWRLISQSIAMSLYLIVTPLTRYGVNADYLPSVSWEDYRNSLVYAAANLVFIFLVMILGYLVLSKRYHDTYHEIIRIQGSQLFSHTFVGFVLVIIVHNLILSNVFSLLSQYCIYNAFDSQGCVIN